MPRTAAVRIHSALLLLLVPFCATPAIAATSIDYRRVLRAPDEGEILYYEGYYQVSGQRSVHYTVFTPNDDAPHDAILFLHGYEKDDYSWAIHQYGVALRGQTGVAIDYNERADQDEMLAEVEAAVQALQGDESATNVALCGTSFGGKVAYETVARFPELNIRYALLLYPSKPHTTKEESAAIRADILNLVGEVDPLRPASKWIADQIATYNQEIDYRLFLYDADEFPTEARHGYFFAPSPDTFNEVAIDSMIRCLDYGEWRTGEVGTPVWLSDPDILQREDLLEFDDSTRRAHWDVTSKVQNGTRKR
jgi:dienelactone hydrolase